ncbi:MAG: M48 family metallopeptidase [Alphaproteobacteria bacterium]|nr:M48 family metallopeptidase [Alphaproteobacteria bacterium]MCW5741030.1 M48 family metallopeptidase [Alphaproteobacteria bacterium]
MPPPEAITVDHAGMALVVIFERSPRARRVSLRVDQRSGRVRLVAPPRMARETALGFARAQAAWIHSRTLRMTPPVPFADGAEIPLFGTPHVVRHRPERRGTVWLEEGALHVAGRMEHLPRRLHDWLSGELRVRVSALAHAKAASIARRVTRITVRDTATQWGSCTRTGGLSFSTRLAFAPPEIVDYVVAHEVAHLVHANHGPQFWALTERLAESDVAASRAWLRRNGERLMRLG